MILIPSHVLQADQPGRTRHHQIEITVAVEIGGHQRGRVPRRSFDRQRLEGGLRDRPPLAQDHDPVRTGGGEVEPAVVVGVKGEHRREALPFRQTGEIPGGEAASSSGKVVPEGDSIPGGDHVRQAVVVEIGAAVREVALTQIVEPGDPLGMGHHEVEIAVAVEIARHQGPDAGERRRREGLLPHRFQRPLEGVAEEVDSRASNHQIEIPLDVVVEHGGGLGSGRAEARSGRGVLEAPIPLAVPEGQPLGTESDQIEIAVVVEIGGDQAGDPSCLRPGQGIAS